MFTLKYKVTNVPSDPSHHFDLDAFRHCGRIHNIKSWIFDRVSLAVFWFLREVWPNPQLWRFVLVTRAADVEQVLKDSEHFGVPFGPEMTALAGANSILGMDGTDHAYQNDIVRKVLRSGDLEKILRGTQTLSRDLIRNSAGKIDAVRDLITRVSTGTCSDYFGLNIEDHEAFAEWSIAMSMLLFADPFGDEKTRQAALAGAARMRQLIHRAIGQARSSPDDATIIGRLVLLQAEQAKTGQPKILSDGEICGILMSLVTGFVPTNTLAAGKILQELLRRPGRMQSAKAMARRGDKDGLKGILLEAARFNAALSPGQWRYATKQQTIAAGRWRRKKVKAGSILLVATRSALRDRRAIKNPAHFIENRDIDPNLMFGFGPHQCLGKYIAIAHIVEIFAILLSQENLRRSAGVDGQFEWIGPFPERLDMEFDGAASTAVQSMITVCAPLIKGASVKGKIEELILALETEEPQPPAETPQTAPRELFTRALERTGLVHFASLCVIEAGDAKRSRPYLVLELNVDGAERAALDAVAQHAGAHLKPIFDWTPRGGSKLAETLKAYTLRLRTRPWGATGLNFNGTPEFSVADIARQQRLAAFARDALAFFIELHSGIGSRAMPAVRFIRKFIRQDERFVAGANDPDNPKRERFKELLASGAEFQDYLSLPGRKRLAISSWVERSREDALYHFLESRDFWYPASPFIVLAAVLSVGIFLAMDANDWLGFPGQVLIGLTGGVVSTALFIIIALAAFFLVLRAHERTDIPDDQDPKLSEVRAVAARENLPRHAQNHFMAVTPLKIGWFRKLTLAVSLWGIKQLVHHAYRSGFVLNMGTIHYAKWFRLPKTDKLIFLSNYDGSWESYLEDFIMKAHPGQTAAWSNGVGFPKTNYLIHDGAKDGDRFKRWVRRQQVPTQFWYSRFSELTTDQIRTHAIIHDGLVRANTDSSARNWLDCFGSMQRPDHAIETEEIQSLVFRGFNRSDYVGYALIDFSDARTANWLQCLVPSMALYSNQYGVTDQPGEKVSTLTFGDHPFNEDRAMRDMATFVAFSAAGLHKLGIPLGDSEDGLSTFASAFNIGMANRRRILGDLEDRSPKWRWSDADPVNDDGTIVEDLPTAHAILMVYGHSAERCDEALAAHEALLGGKAFIATIRAQPVENENASRKKNIPREHFGFRDGISQPVIRGTQRFTEGALEADTVEPGEFILGYKNNQGYYPPAARVRADSDVHDHLPDVLVSSPPRFPSFGTSRSAARDFGRNGSFLVVRQIQQHVEKFNAFTNSAKSRLTAKYENLSAMVGADVTEEWVAGKMMGRWKTGKSLVVRPGADRGEKPRKLSDTENDFSFGLDDPQGLHCPFGAHIRRANPRDGLQPDDAMQRAISNRHRLLRRGRTYEISEEEAAKQGGPGPEKGLVFTCLCADLERQFEFVQQTWIGSSSFHGLGGEVDPIVGWKDATSVFTIPTPSGPLTLNSPDNFVTVHAGGYFFLPSLSAVKYLLDIAGREAEKKTMAIRA